MKRLAAWLAMGALVALAACVSARRPPARSCAEPVAFAAAAAYNRAAEANLAFTPFGRAESGWAIYAPLIAREVRSSCPTGSPGFAAAVSRWQARAGLPRHGGVDEASFVAMKTAWQNRRPFVRLRAAEVCPAPPPAAELTALPDSESWRGAKVRMRTGAARALIAMTAAARREVPAIAADPEALTAFSGYRSPGYDAARCAREGNCDGVVRAACSAHRTGLAVDLVLDAAPGFSADSSADANRLYQSRTPAYRWLVANAGRFGFVNYAFEPWHWEWTGEAP
jgi:hypothetical protein